jgi:phosphopantothenoylcysteine synthetase/decarboxylase
MKTDLNIPVSDGLERRLVRHASRNRQIIHRRGPSVVTKLTLKALGSLQKLSTRIFHFETNVNSHVNVEAR